MRFEWVHAEAFGPLQDQLLRFSPGLNVVTGGNEAGKSSWHAAIYAALCGMRRARGRPSHTDEQFAARHAPWDGGPWQVRALVTLADGRRVELEQDLKGRVACRATDADLGRDYSNEIMGDGAPDGARWLGLDRRAFLATACVRQADLLGCLREPGLLQEHLQAAAATAGADGTAAAALERVARCRSERIGLDRSNSVKPLATAKRRLAEAEAALQRVRIEHDEYLRLAEQARQQAEAEAGARRRLALVEAARAETVAHDMRHRFQRAQTLACEADVEIHPEVAAAGAAYRSAAEAVRRHEAARPQAPAPQPGDVSGGGLERRGLVRPRLDASPTTGTGPLELIGTATLALVGVALLVAGQPLVGGVALVLGLAAAAGSLLRSGDRQWLALRTLADGRHAAARGVWAAEQWTATEARLRTEFEDAAGALSTALRERGATADRDLDQGLDAYAAACRHQRELLQALLRGRTLDELRADAERREAAAERLREGLALEDLAGVDLEADTAAQLQRLGQAVEEASEAAAFTRGRLERDAGVLRQVPEAEEEAASARAELARLERLDATLDTTARFLRSAQDRVHRDIAPVLADAIRRLLPEVTLGRYHDARIDPASLEVQVREVGGYWRRAELLSHGTAEQVYLLLRVALAQHLTRWGEVCPLLLDDVTVQSDAERTLSILRALALVSRERQIILLSQATQVRDWARTNLGPRDQLIELDAPVPQLT